MHSPSITESPNELTYDIDVASPEQIVRLLRASDAQIYNGYRGYPAVSDPEIVAKIAQAVEWAAPMMGRKDAAIVISGAGTSGRLAMFAARTFNRLLCRQGKVPNFHYLIAGGDLALIKAQEKAEDDPHQAWTDLEPLVRGKKQVLCVGITCAFAAPYVAAQLLRMSRVRGAKCVLMGFNPEDRARDLEVENWDRTFADVVRTISKRANCLILNPVVGPEPVTGSTRMKGGSATKLLLETVFGLAANRSGSAARVKPADDACDFVLGYERARVAAYARLSDIARLIELGGQALRHGGHIYYVGAGATGILGIVDASECPPTFGAGFDDVRGFLAGGWRELLGPGRDLTDAGPWYRISLNEFESDILSHINRNDLVVALPPSGWDARLGTVLRRCRRAGAAVAAVRVGTRTEADVKLDIDVCVPQVPRSKISGARVYAEYATKLILNALTTGAHILCGKVYRNRMVDLRISNNKLYHRTLGIIQDVTGVSADDAKRALLRSLYGVDRVTPALMRAKPSAHVEAATNASKVVPRALIMAGSRATYADAEKLLRNEPVVRNAITRLKGGTKKG